MSLVVSYLEPSLSPPLIPLSLPLSFPLLAFLSLLYLFSSPSQWPFYDCPLSLTETHLSTLSDHDLSQPSLAILTLYPSLPLPLSACLPYLSLLALSLPLLLSTISLYPLSLLPLQLPYSPPQQSLSVFFSNSLPLESLSAFISLPSVLSRSLQVSILIFSPPYPTNFSLLFIFF